MKKNMENEEGLDDKTSNTNANAKGFWKNLIRVPFKKIFYGISIITSIIWFCKPGSKDEKDEENDKS